MLLNLDVDRLIARVVDGLKRRRVIGNEFIDLTEPLSHNSTAPNITNDPQPSTSNVTTEPQPSTSYARTEPPPSILTVAPSPAILAEILRSADKLIQECEDHGKKEAMQRVRRMKLEQESNTETISKPESNIETVDLTSTPGVMEPERIQNLTRTHLNRLKDLFCYLRIRSSKYTDNINETPFKYEMSGRCGASGSVDHQRIMSLIDDHMGKYSI